MSIQYLQPHNYTYAGARLYVWPVLQHIHQCQLNTIPIRIEKDQFKESPRIRLTKKTQWMIYINKHYGVRFFPTFPSNPTIYHSQLPLLLKEDDLTYLIISNLITI